MRETSYNSFQFAPGDPGNITQVADLLRYVQDMEQRLASALSALASGKTEVLYAPPDKPRAVTTVIADGVSWNPGGGYGIYAYNGATWILVKAL